MTTTELVLAGAAASSVSWLWVWIRQDGLIHTAAAYVAIFHSDPARRRDARRVSDAYLRGRDSKPPRGTKSRRLPKPRRGRRADPDEGV